MLGLGPRCRRFESCHLDQPVIRQNNKAFCRVCCFFRKPKENFKKIEKNSKKGLTNGKKCDIINKHCESAGVAQLVEQLICNQQVGGSSPFTSSNIFAGGSRHCFYGRIPEWPKGADCKSVAFRFDGSNPSSPTSRKFRQDVSDTIYGIRFFMSKISINDTKRI